MSGTAGPRTVCLAVACLLLVSGCASSEFWNRKRRAEPHKPSAVNLSNVQKAEIHVALGLSAERGGNSEKAVQAYTQALELDDTRADAYHRLALVHDKRGEGEQAQELYLKALELAPNVAEIHCDLAYNLYLHGRWDEAEQGLHRAISLRPDLARAHNNLGLLLARTGRADEAMVEFGRAGASATQARVNLAFALIMDGHTAAAEQQLDLATAQGSGQEVERIARIRSAIRGSQGIQAAAPSVPFSVNQPVSYQQPVYVQKTHPR